MILCDTKRLEFIISFFFRSLTSALKRVCCEWERTLAKLLLCPDMLLYIVVFVCSLLSDELFRWFCTFCYLFFCSRHFYEIILMKLGAAQVESNRTWAKLLMIYFENGSNKIWLTYQVHYENNRIECDKNTTRYLLDSVFGTDLFKLRIT